MISAGCIIEGTVTNSVLSPGVWVRKGAVVNNSVIFHDSVIEEGAKVDLAICDKRVYVREGAVVGQGEDLHVANRLFPKTPVYGDHADRQGGAGAGPCPHRAELPCDLWF